MIDHISIKNFAIIENAEVDFQPGLNIITGETGAGKSIVIEAVSLALGSRADTSSIRHGASKAVVQLTGTLDGEEIVISREVSQSGKNLCRLNGEIVTLAQLNKICSRLADIHGQYDNQSLMNPENHIAFLDSYRSDRIAPEKEKVSELYEIYSKARSALVALLNLEKENTRKMDFYRFELDEINKADPKPGEDEQLEERVQILENSEKIFKGIESTYSLLFGQSASVYDALGSASKSIESVSSYSKELAAVSSDISDLYYRLQDISSDLRSLRDGMSFSPNELDDALSRLNTLDNLKRKYGNSLEEIIAYRDDIAEKISLFENSDAEKLRLQKELISARNILLKECEVLTSIRRSSADELEKLIQEELVELNFKDTKVRIDITPLEHPSPSGMDNVEIFISTNRGEPLKPLYKVASGGEMSRIMLAFKKIISSCDHIPTLIFDEIDNGISGITASIVGTKLREIAEEHQILCITHLPQIAACGDYNYRIYKESDEGSTFTHISPLESADKVKEIARLLGGTNITETTLRSAEELIAASVK